MIRYNSVYDEAIGQQPVPSLDGRFLYDSIVSACGTPLEVRNFLKKNPEICAVIRERYSSFAEYRDVTIIMLAWLVKNRKNFLREIFPLPQEKLESIALSFGEAYQ